MKKSVKGLTPKQEEDLKNFKDSVNMTPSALEKWLKTEESKEVGYKGKKGNDKESVGHHSGRRIIEIKRKKKSELTREDFAHMRRVYAYIQRHSAQKPKKEELKTSKWRYSLMNWGNDPLKS